MKNKLSYPKLTALLSLVYFTSYLTRKNFAAISQAVIEQNSFGYVKTDLSLAFTLLFITYGVGQVVNGYIGDKIKPQNLIFCGLIIATVINALFPLAFAVLPLVWILWAINGFAQAMMWPPIVKILVTNLTDKQYNTAVLLISTASSIATIVLYVFSPLVFKNLGWEAVFYICAGASLASTVLWFFLKDGCGEFESVGLIHLHKDNNAPKAKLTIPKETIFPLIFIVFAIIMQGMLRDGIETWMPNYLTEVFKWDSSNSIMITVLLAIISVATFYISTFLYEKFFTNEVTCASVFFGVGTAFALLLYVLFDSSIVSVISMTIISGCMHGVNLMLITHVPKRYKRYGNISTMSGLVNACTYIGSALASYGIAYISENSGYKVTVLIWFFIALVGTLCCATAIRRWKKHAIDAPTVDKVEETNA